NVHQDGGDRRVVVPDVMPHELEMPQTATGLDIECDQAGPEQVVARPEATPEVERGRVRRNVDYATLHVRGHRCPRGDFARPAPRIVLPGLVAYLAGTRDDVELPFELTCPRVVSEDVAR